ncbi:hypothetical protein Tco_1383142 [Tanacetum coccineum]
MTLLLCNVTVPPSTGISHSYAVPLMVQSGFFYARPMPIIALCWDGDLSEHECSAKRKVEVAETNLIPFSLRQLGFTKHAHIKTSKDAHRHYIYPMHKCVRPMSTSMIIGLSSFYSLRGGKDMLVSEEKLWVIFGLATFPRLARELYFLEEVPWGWRFEFLSSEPKISFGVFNIFPNVVLRSSELSRILLVNSSKPKAGNSGGFPDLASSNVLTWLRAS